MLRERRSGDMLTIITACYNGLSSAGAEAVRRCIMSVARLPFPHEHLIMDGASSDGSVEFIKGLNAPSSQIYSEKDSGIYDALNKGIAKAKGDYIYVLGLDDYIENPEAMAKAWQAATMGRYDIVISPVKFPNGFFWPKRRSKVCRLYYYMPFSHQGVLARTELLQAQGGYDASYSIVADHKHLLSAVMQGCSVQYVPEQYAYMGVNGTSAKLKEKLRHEARRLHREFYPSGNECRVQKGILPLVNIVRLIFFGRSRFVRRMGACALNQWLYTKVKTDSHKVFYVLGMPVLRLRHHILRKSGSEE